MHAQSDLRWYAEDGGLPCIHRLQHLVHTHHITVGCGGGELGASPGQREETLGLVQNDVINYSLRLDLRVGGD